MSRFIVNPPIKHDSDYYRFDEEEVQRVLNGESMLALGLRCSGKTSFLYRLQRAAVSAERTSLIYELPDLFAAERPDARLAECVDEITANPDAIVLLDEVDVFSGYDRSLLTKLANACRKRTIVLSCAPVFVMELNKYPEVVQDMVESCQRHLLGPLKRNECFALLSQAKRAEASPINKSIVDRIWRSGDRLPIVLQAWGIEHVENVPRTVALAGVGVRLLRGLTSQMRESLVLAAHDGHPDPHSFDVELLTALGALDYSSDRTKVSIRSPTLKGIIRAASVPPLVTKKETVCTSVSRGDWQLHARILHLSDLHFGPHCVESKDHATDRQLARFRAVLEEDLIRPDFIVVTGDLSWSGRRDELSAAEEFLEGLVKWFGKSRSWQSTKARQRVLLVPGNHDAAWSLTRGLPDKETDEWVCYSSAPFAMLFNRFHRRKVVWDLEHPCQWRHFAAPSVAFVSLSTCNFVTEKRKYGEFGVAVQDSVVKALEQRPVSTARFRIALMHHNLRAFHADGQVIRDVEHALKRFARCKPSLDLILHGHSHQGDVDAFKPRGGLDEIAYSAVGSFGVRAEDRPGDNTRGRVANEFSVIDLETSGAGRRFTTQFYRLQYSATGGWEWTAGKKCTPRVL